MNYTEKYHLPQWEETDRIMRTDFNEAMAGIETGLTEAYSPDNPLYVTGIYTGNGTSQTITLGFTPRFVAISGVNPGTVGNSYIYVGMTGGNQGMIALREEGFYVWHASGIPKLNEEGRVYDYIAFR